MVIPVLSLNEMVMISTGSLSASPRTSKPQTRLAIVAGAWTVTFFMHYDFAVLMISAKTPDAVTSAPAPAPFTTSGCSVYLLV